VEILDDLDDHWTAKDHKDERRVVIEDLQDLAADKSVRVTILRYVSFSLVPIQEQTLTGAAAMSTWPP